MASQPPAGFVSPILPWHNKSYPDINPSRPELSAAGKNVVVTGGGTSIGADTARAFAQAGATNIAIIGRREAPLFESKRAVENSYPKTVVYTYVADVTNAGEINAALLAFATTTGGYIDILIVNAGKAPSPATIIETDPMDWWSAFQTNVQGTFNTLRAFKPHARPGKNASSVVYVNSASAHVGVAYAPSFSAYSCSKLAAARVIDYFGIDNRDIHVINVHPGIIDTPIQRLNPLDAYLPHDDLSLASSFIVWAACPEAFFARGKFVWANWDIGALKTRADDFRLGGEEYLLPTDFNIGMLGYTTGSAKDIMSAKELENSS